MIHEVAWDSNTNAVLLTIISSVEADVEALCGEESCGILHKEISSVLIQPIKITAGIELLKPYILPENYLSGHSEIVRRIHGATSG